VSSLVAFLLFVAPGIVFEILRERRLPQEDRTALREAATVALASVILSFVALGLLAGLRVVAPSMMPVLGAWISHPHHYLVKHYALVSGAVLAEVVLAIALAIVGPALWTHKYRGTRILSETRCGGCSTRQSRGPCRGCRSWRATA
jgi:hypothetical protein